MKLTNFKIIPFVLMVSSLLALNGCDKSSTSSDSALAGVAPVAVNDSGVGVSGAPATILVVANDTDVENNLDVSSVQIIGTANAGDSLVVTGEGTWSVDAAGNVTFTPEIGFTNDPSVIEYIVSDTNGLVSNSATVTIDYPQTAPVAYDDDANGTSGFATTVDVLANDTDAENDINTSSIHITGTTNPGDTLVVAGEGNWSVSPVHTVIFTPEAGFTGDPESITYIITDNTGLTSNAATVSIDYPQTAPVAVDDNETNTTLGAATTLNVVANDTDAENDINASTVNFVDGNATDENGDDYADSLVVAGEGNWTVDADGNVTFTPEAGFIGDPTPIFYTVTDRTGLESNEANITIDYPNLLASCRAYLENGLSVGDGMYMIDPDGVGGIDPFEAYCDMTSDGGGYTIKTVTTSSALLAPAAEAYCSDNFGMHLFVPRTEAHFTAAVTAHGAEYFYIMGIYPNVNGATCINTPFNSASCTTWAPKDGGIWYVSNRTDIAEPNGDNNVDQSMGYAFSGTTLANYNDIVSGYSSQNFACSALDDPKAQTFVNNTPLSLMDMSTVTSQIIVTNAISSINKVTVHINSSGLAPYDNEYRLESPFGTVVLLSDNRGTDPTFIATFDDNATILMSDQTFSSTINGTYVPEEPLSAVNGENANGTWTLNVVDNIPIITNTLNSWSITIE
ncbi:Ig-like domain-containing protein [Sulfurovum sp. zt1-1]|uniref:Ig-like domain-containing protein n=1 Tax=Sulfurovum zhangzhouensis TaxID=3019067 RepID=A0ABT7QVF4_9BACT|nr:Ig-like domain-containing protein [Sulfurovum zhangzhouensis]MDM5270827.1 Ig-like domain-containing protein [Sulfurovum zhangzhouensis]